MENTEKPIEKKPVVAKRQPSAEVVKRKIEGPPHPEPHRRQSIEAFPISHSPKEITMDLHHVARISLSVFNEGTYKYPLTDMQAVRQLVEEVHKRDVEFRVIAAAIQVPLQVFNDWRETPEVFQEVGKKLLDWINSIKKEQLIRDEVLEGQKPMMTESVEIQVRSECV